MTPSISYFLKHIGEQDSLCSLFAEADLPRNICPSYKYRKRSNLFCAICFRYILFAVSRCKCLRTTSQPARQIQCRYTQNVVWSGRAWPPAICLPPKFRCLWSVGISSMTWVFCFEVVDGVGAFDLLGYDFTGQSIFNDFHSSAQTQDQVQGRFLLDIVISKGAAIF